MKAGMFAGALALVLGMAGASAADPVENRLKAIEARQDSILAILRTMQSQSEFVALKVGWRPAADTSPKNIPVGNSFTRGPANAPLTVVEFSDMQCPYCAQLTPVLDAVAKAYPNDVRFVFKNFPLPFHPQSRTAAAAAMAAGAQGKFFEFRSRIAPKYRTLNDSLYLAVARDLGLDVERFRRDMPLTPELNKRFDEDMALGQQLGVEGTPTVFVNGRLAEDRSFEYFANQVQKAKR